MRPWLPLLLCFVSALAQAQPPRVEKSTVAESAADRPRPAEAPRPVEAPRRNAAVLAIFLTDDQEYLRLPTYASRTPPQQIRFIRVGVEWWF